MLESPWLWIALLLLVAGGATWFALSGRPKNKP